MREFHLRDALPGGGVGTVASPNLPARQGISLLRHAHTPKLIGGSRLRLPVTALGRPWAAGGVQPWDRSPLTCCGCREAVVGYARERSLSGEGRTTRGLPVTLQHPHDPDRPPAAGPSARSSTGPSLRPRRRWAPSARTTASVLAVGALTLAATVSATTTAAALAAPAAATASGVLAAAGDSPFGEHVVVFDPSMPVSEIQATVDAIYAQQVDDEMGTEPLRAAVQAGHLRHGRPSRCRSRSATTPRSPGLGASPTDVTINGKIEVYNRCLEDGGTSNCLALVNFWRTLSNLTLDVNGAGQDGCRASANFWAVSQAVSMRRVNVTRRQPLAHGLLHRRAAVRQRRLHRRLQRCRSSSTARSSSG